MTKIPSLFPCFDCQSTCVLGRDPPDALHNQVMVSIPDEEQEEQSISAHWPDQPSDETAAKFSNEK